MKGIVRIRLARFGRRHQPFFNIVVTKAKKARDAKPIEVIGTYNPVPLPLTPEQKAAGERPIKDIKLDFTKSKYWISVGAQPSETVTRLFKKAGILHSEWPSPAVGPVVPERKVLEPKKEL